MIFNESWKGASCSIGYWICYWTDSCGINGWNWGCYPNHHNNIRTVIGEISSSATINIAVDSAIYLIVVNEGKIAWEVNPNRVTVT